MRHVSNAISRLTGLAVLGLVVLAWSMLAVKPCLHGLAPGALCAVAAAQAAHGEGHADGECCPPAVCVAVTPDEQPVLKAAAVPEVPSVALAPAAPLPAAAPAREAGTVPPDPHPPRRPVWQLLGVMRL